MNPVPFNRPKKLRVLMVSPEICHFPKGMKGAAGFKAKAGGLSEVVGMLADHFYSTEQIEIFLAVPNYREMFKNNHRPAEIDPRICLAEDSHFFYREKVYESENADKKAAVAFNREVVNHVIPTVKPDIVHCHDWMTFGVVAACKQLRIPVIFTLHNSHSVQCGLEEIQQSGFDTMRFWNNFYFNQFPPTSHNAALRSGLQVDFLLTCIFACDFVNTVSPSYLKEILSGAHPSVVKPAIRRELAAKVRMGRASGILNAPDPGFNPREDEALAEMYGSESHIRGKMVNKRNLQSFLGLRQDMNAAVFLWPHRMDPFQKGCDLLKGILPEVTKKYKNIQMVFCSDGPSFKSFRHIVENHGLKSRVTLHPFDETLQRLAYGGADFMLMPSKYEPCGLPQMICQIYGALPVARETGGIHDTVSQLGPAAGTGNGFLFKDYSEQGLFGAIDDAMSFFRLPVDQKAAQIERIMAESVEKFKVERMGEAYQGLYERVMAMKAAHGVAA